MNHSTLNDEELALRDTKSGKLLFTEYRKKLCAFFLQDNRLLAAQVMTSSENQIGAVYIGKIKNVVKNINACFVEIANEEICFLPMKTAIHPILLNRAYDGRLLEGDEILVQLSKEAHKTKGATVTAAVSLSNDYAAICIGNQKIGFSDKLSKERKDELKVWLSGAGILREKSFVWDAEIPLDLIIRTKAGEGGEELLLSNIKAIYDEFLNMIHIAKHRTCFSCIRQAPENFEVVLEQLAYPDEYQEMITDDAALYEKLNTYAKEKLLNKNVRLYEDTVLSLSKLYSLEQKMDTALNKRVWLKSGGYLIIEPTEALTVIDVNTGKYEPKKASLRQNADATYELINREAAKEVALQLRLRNMSGIIVVDFINMKSEVSRDSLLEYLRELVRKDRVKTTVVDMTQLGLVEITRQKSNKPLWELML
uniref:ribonuclease E/G n=1 Tax=Acetatifactor sp. TaxID=1872090 RepID=UPI0040578C99